MYIHKYIVHVSACVCVCVCVCVDGAHCGQPHPPRVTLLS